jgi:hypothetical protein
VYFLRSHVEDHLNDPPCYCTFLCTRSNYALRDTVLRGDSVVTFRKAKADFRMLKEANGVLRREGVDPYLSYFDELAFARDVDEIHVLGGSELVFPKKTYSREEPLRSLENSFHDVVEEGYERLIDEAYTDNPIIHFPISTFMYYYSGVLLATIMMAHRRGRLGRVKFFCVDPTASVRFLGKYGIRCEELYLAEDKRGSRNFERYDFGTHVKAELRAKAKHDLFCDFFGVDGGVDFVFGGRLLAPSRREDYERFFMNLTGVSKKVFTPSTMSLRDKETVGEGFYPPVPYWDFIRELGRARYTLLMRPWTKNDSLNIRLYEALALGVLPLVADNYDPHSMQVDRRLFGELGLIVSSSEDITRVIRNTPEAQRLEALRIIEESH